METSVARFEQRMAEPDSPIRPIRHRPRRREGEYAEFPASIAHRLKVREARGIPRLYTHQAEAFD